MRRIAAFTLVELLVVIGVIALLIAVLLPAVSAARRQAQLTKCLAVEREIATAVALHAQAHQGYFPIAGQFNGVPESAVTGVPPESVGDPGRRRYTYMIVTEGAMKGLTLAPWQAAVASFMGKKTTLDGGNNADLTEEEIGTSSYLAYFLCPAHSSAARDVDNSLIYTGGNLGWMIQQSYVINEAVFGINDALGRLRGKASRVRRPAVTMMLADGLQSLPRGQRVGAPTMGWMTLVNHTADAPITLADAFEEKGKAGDAQNFDLLRHRGRVNIAFFDGHAETRRITTDDLKNVFLLSN